MNIGSIILECEVMYIFSTFKSKW